MTSLEEKKLLKDIEEAILSIDEHLEGRRVFAEFAASKTKRRATERELEIIGEAMSNLLKISPDISVSNARPVVDLRNKVIHGYDTIDEIIIWKIIMKDVPLLLQEVRQLLKEE
jgi:uncharacterized protein with HEPN domain